MVSRLFVVLAFVPLIIALSAHWPNQSTAAGTEAGRPGKHEAVRTDDRWGPANHLLCGCLVVERDIRRVRGDYEMIVELQNRCGHPAVFEFDPKDLKVEVFDAAGKPIAEPAIIRSGPIPQPHHGVISPRTYVGLTTHRGGVGVPRRLALFAAGWQCWRLAPGKYTVRGTTKVTISHREEWLEPLAPSRSSPQWQEKGVLPLGEKRTVILDLGETTFEIAAADPAKELSAWSKPINGIQARLELVEKSRLYGVRWLVPYLELRNVRDLMNPIEVECNSRNLKVELVDEDGKVVSAGWLGDRTGPYAEPGTVVLPVESSIRFSLECRNWGIPGGTDAMIATDSGAWTIDAEQKGRVFLRATLTGEETKPHWKRWHGELQTPLLAVDWD